MLTELGYGQVDVLGISWGGAVAQHFAAFQRSRCRRLVLVATATGALMVPARPSVLANLVTPRRYLDRGYLERMAGSLYGGSARDHPGADHGGDEQRQPGGAVARVPVPARRRGGLDQRAVPAAGPPADAHRRRRRRPDHPAGQRPADEQAHSELAAARLPRRSPRPGDRGGTARAGGGRLPGRTVTRENWHGK